MAPPPTHLQPHVQLTLLAIAARRRGLSFEAFWREAIREGKPPVMTNRADPPSGCVRWPTDTNERVSWQKAIGEMREGWRRAYEREEPTPGEQAVLMLGEGIGALARVSDARAAEELDRALPAQAALVSAA